MLYRLIAPALCLGLLLAVLPTANAQGGKAPKKTEDKTKKDEKKASPELEKARGEVKRLHEEMQKLLKQMKATGEKLHKAHAEVAKLGGHKKGEHGFGYGHLGMKGSHFGHHGMYGHHHFGHYGMYGHHHFGHHGMHGRHHYGSHYGHHGMHGRHHYGHHGMHGRHHYGHHGMAGRHPYGSHGMYGSKGGPKGGFGELKLTDEQKKKAGELMKKMHTEFEKILTPEQKKIFEKMHKGFKGGPGTKGTEKKTKSAETSLEQTGDHQRSSLAFVVAEQNSAAILNRK